jgi:predicted DNA-binding transcriptional regulator
MSTSKKVKHPKMDKKLVAYKQLYEVKDMCRKFKIKKADFLAIISLLPHKHSMKEVEAALIGYGYAKHPRKKVIQNGATDEGFSVE